VTVPIVVPYHQDESLPAGDLPVSGHVVTPVLPDGEVRTRRAALGERVVVGPQRAGHDPVVV
jgi:arginase